MNRRQEIALLFIVAAFVATWMFPPWIDTRYEAGRFPPAPQPRTVGYRFVFTWAQGGLPEYDFHTIDWGRLLLENLMIAAVGGWSLYALRSKS